METSDKAPNRERIRRRVREVLHDELGIENYVLAMKDPDSDEVHDAYSGCNVWVCGAVKLLEIRSSCYLIESLSESVDDSEESD